MISCPTCQTQHLPNTFFCDQCGTALHGAARDNRTADAAILSTPFLRILVQATGLTMTLPLTDEIVIGRKDTDTGVRPDVDLGILGDSGLSVSRTHARIRRVGTTVQIEDLGSTNGTWLQGKRLPAHNPLALEEGKGYEVIVGTVHLTLSVQTKERPPVRPPQ
ncbi:MAG: FHA domain-containing protein [Chloroflexi bacterium]|nr:FHA domain-containing protein [Chloroflexota bacterium]